MKNTNKLVAFHGSVCSVAQPLIERSVHNSELGKGFIALLIPCLHISIEEDALKL